jgi:hypothetical protein
VCVMYNEGKARSSLHYNLGTIVMPMMSKDTYSIQRTSVATGELNRKFTINKVISAASCSNKVTDLNETKRSH